MRIKTKPGNDYDPKQSEALLACAKTYLENRDRLIYSFGGRTFLTGFDLFDPEYKGSGNIDCSSFILLVISGIPYQKSPYAGVSVKELHAAEGFLSDPDLVDFSKLPEHYIPIAERIGHPELKGPKGLDLKKAEEAGIDLKTLVDKIEKSGLVRWSAKIADYFLKREQCFSDASDARPGDLVFYRFPDHFTEGNRKYKSNPEISHVGILTKDPSKMINSTGSYKKEKNAGGFQPAISIDPVFGKRLPAFFARPVFSE